MAESAEGAKLQSAEGAKLQRTASEDSSLGKASATGSHQFLVILSKQQAMDIYTMRSPDFTTDANLKVKIPFARICLSSRPRAAPLPLHIQEPQIADVVCLQAVAGKSSMVAEMYGVSPKTVRAYHPPQRKLLPLHHGRLLLPLPGGVSFDAH